MDTKGELIERLPITSEKPRTEAHKGDRQMNKHELDRFFVEMDPGFAETIRQQVPLVRMGAVIRRHRLDLGLSQEELAEAVGSTQGKISRLERAQNGNPSFQTMERLADALGIEFHELTEPAIEVIHNTELKVLHRSFPAEPPTFGAEDCEGLDQMRALG